MFEHIAHAIRSSPLVAEFAEIARREDFSRLDKNQAKRHHFVPQFLLQGFSHEHNGKDHLFQMEMSSRRAPRRVPVRTAASRRRLYRITDEDGQTSNRHEGYLALVESHAAPVVQRLTTEQTPSLPPGDRATIAFFVALQTMRTPAAAVQVTALANAAFRSWACDFFSDRAAHAEQHRDVYGTGASAEEIEQHRQDLLEQIQTGQMRLGGEDGAAFAAGFEHAMENAPMLIEFDWTLLRAPEAGFITSDRGFAIHDPTPPFPWSAQGLLSSENSETAWPLSDTTCLLMRPNPVGGGLSVRKLSKREVETINLRTYGWAREHVFARSQDALVSVRLAARRHPADVIRPIPFPQIALLELDPDDDRLADENRSRGWPAHLENKNGERCDYIVIPTDAPHAELEQRVNDLVERRARKRAAVRPDEVRDGSIVTTPLHPLDIKP